MAVEVGLEPTAATLTALCSTIELLYNMEPRVGLEPTTVALQKRCSSQLSYQGIWRKEQESNLGTVKKAFTVLLL